MNKTIKNNLLSRFLNSVFLLVVLSVLSACGGGGGGGGTPTLTISDVSVAEGNSGTTAMTFTLTLSGAAGSGASVAYATSDGSATAGSDYIASSGTQSFTAGASSATITITVNGDTSIEDDESLVLTLSSPSGVSLGATTLTATGTISNDDNGGYYSGTGSTTSPALTLSSLKAIFDNDTFVVISTDNDLLYKGNITSRNGNSYTANVDIYLGGAFQSSATVNGTQISGSSVTGVLSGTGDYANGDFTLDYSIINTQTPPVFGNTDEWYSSLFPPPVYLTFTSNTSANIRITTNPSSTDIAGCRLNGVSLINVNSESPGRIRSFSGNFTGCSTTPAETAVQGYFTTFDDSGTDDAMIFVLYSATHAQLDWMCFNGCP